MSSAKTKTTASKVSSISPNSTRRVRTDLGTSQNRYLTKSNPPTRSRTSSPITITTRQQQQPYQSPYRQTFADQMQNNHSCYVRGHTLGLQDKQSSSMITTKNATLHNDKSKQKTTTDANTDGMAVTSAVANARRYIRRSNFILTAAKHVVDDSRIFSTSAPHEGSTYLSSHLPARATRLLNRSRMQQHCALNNDDSDSATKSPLSIRRRTNTASSRNSTASSNNNNSNGGRNSNTANASLHRRYQQNHYLHHHQASTSSSSFHQSDKHSSSDDLMLYDKSFRNAMIQDVLQFKKQLLRLRKILQETETLNPFENDNGQLFTSCGLDSKLLDDIDLASLTSSTTDDPLQELTDLRRQVVYLQGQVDDRDRTIRLQKNLIEQLEAEKHKAPQLGLVGENAKECVTSATQTERTRPLSIGTEGLSRSKPEFTSFTTYYPAVCSDTTTVIQHQQQSPSQNQGSVTNNQTRRHTIISTTLTNYNHQISSQNHQTPRRASIAWDKQTASVYKPVKITLIGEPLKQWDSNCNSSSVSVSSSCNEDISLHMTNKHDLRQNLINSNTQDQQQHQLQQKKHNNFKSNGKNQQNLNAHVLPQRLQDIMNASGVRAQTMPLCQPHQFHHHRHQQNNLKPTVTIV